MEWKVLEDWSQCQVKGGGRWDKEKKFLVVKVIKSANTQSLGNVGGDKYCWNQPTEKRILIILNKDVG